MRNHKEKNYSMRKSLLLFGILITISLQAKKYDITNLTNNDGLSNSSINTIHQDANGLMWFGSWDGLNIYNGREFSIYKPEPGNVQSISNNIIRDIVEESKNVHWVATDRGINCVDMRRKSFERFFVDGEYQTLSDEHSFLIAKNSSNIIFAGVNEKGLFFFDKNTHRFKRLTAVKNYQLRKIFFDQDDNLWLYTDDRILLKVVFKKGKSPEPQIGNVVEFKHLINIESVFYSPTNELWMQSGGGLFSYKISEGILNAFQPGYNTGLIKAALFVDDYQLWGTSNGLFRFDPTTKQVELVMPNVSVLSLAGGTQQIVWVGTDMQGVWQLSPSRDSFRSYSAENIPSFGNSAVRTFFEDPGRTLWVGTKGSGIFTLNPNVENSNAANVQHFNTTNGLLSNSVFTIVKGQENEYWIGTDGRGINYYDLKVKKIKTLAIPVNIIQKVNLTSVYSILPADKSTLWVGTSGYGMYKLEIDRTTNPYSITNYKQYIYEKNKKSLSNNIVYSIINDDADHLWIATRGGGLNRFNKKTEVFETFRFSSNNSDFISSDDVLCLYKDKLGYLWAGTSMGLNKLIRYDKGVPVFTRFTEKEGMPNNTIHGILEDKEHNLWLSTNKGIAKLVKDRDNYRIISYYQKDGLLNNEFSDGAFYESPYTHQLYFGGINGFNVFNPMEITHSTYMPSLLLDAFYVDNVNTNMSDYLKSKNKGETLILSYKNKSFSFRFIPLDYISGSKCEISYQLEGYQKDWIHLGTSNTIVLSNLPKGDYVLKVRCSNADKLWGDNYYSLPIKMLPPWWASNFAYLCYAVLFVLILLLVKRFVKYQYTVRNNIRLKEQEKEKMEEIHQAKLRFFTNIAHEFSNSLTLIYGPCEQLLRTHAADGVTRKYINTIKSNSERMQSLIQQLIDFRKAETGHLKLEIEKVDIAELIKFVVDNFMNVLEKKRIRFNLSFSDTDIIWQTDRDSIEKIVFNLVSNAVKYTPDDEKIDLKVEINDNQLLILVTNTGVGIKPEFQRNIFDRFEVLERFEKQVSKGLDTRNGIGLALCKNIVEVLHGTIDVESDGDTFTTFKVKLPMQNMGEQYSDTLQTKNATPNVTIEPDEEKVNVKERIAIPDVQKEGLVLVIDDEKEIRELLNDFLSDKYEVAEAANGQEAIELMRIRMPILIICDIIMPVMNGVEFVKTMKQQELTRHIPIIFLSTKGTVENQIEGLEVGADAYLSKPFHPRHLEALVENMLHRNKAILDYSESAHAALEQFEGKLIHKEDKELMLLITKTIQEQIDNEDLTLDFIASQTAHSKMQLYRKMKEITGLTPTEYIRTLRLKQSEKLLKTTNKTVQEIMYNCGFNNKAYFYREFAKKYHLTPKEYRNQK